ncbi:MAG: hypothetical protein GX332_01120 [Alcaligenaceae bacterium]|nr:hypothetical protein [Alcaligenaceae bacterium]
MLQIAIDFPDSLIDIDRKITISGAAAHQLVTVQTMTERGNGQVWRSQLVYKSDAQGKVDLSTAVPEGMETALPLQLLYEQRPENAATQDVYPLSVHHALHTQIDVSSEGQQAQTVLTQRLATETVQRVELDQDGVKGVFFVPTFAGDKPAVLVLKSAAEQPVQEELAALYAARGYMALALDYAHTPAAEASKEDLALFECALRWLRESCKPKHQFVAVCGTGQGAQLALLLGVRFSLEVSAVIAWEPATSQFEAQLIAVDQLQGPLLMASGKAHHGSAYFKQVVAQLEQSGFDYRVQWYNFEGVAAGLQPPHIPVRLHCDVASQVVDLATANKTLWFGVIAFLHQAVAEAAIPNQLHA